MSTTTNVYFLVIFLVLLIITSTSSCNARPIEAKEKEPYSKHSGFSTEKDEKASVARVSINPAKVEHSEPYAAAEREEQVYEDKKAKTAENPATKSDAKTRLQLQGAEEELASSSPSVQLNYKPLETQRVTWKLPQKKRGEKQPGFNLDYAPPKTHPPTHN